MSKYFPALILVAMVAIAAFAADVWNVGVASVDTSGNAIFGGNVTATGRVTAAGITSSSALTGTAVFASTSTLTPKSGISTNGIEAGRFEVQYAGANTGLVFIAGTVTNVIDADLYR